MREPPRTLPRIVDPGGDRPAVVFLHPFSSDSRIWEPQLDAFGSQCRIITVDLPGFGPQARPIGAANLGSILGSVLDSLGLMRAHFVGASFGASVAIDFALTYPRRVHSLTLVSPTLNGKKTGIASWAECIKLANSGDRVSAIELYLMDPIFDGLRRQEMIFEYVRSLSFDYSCLHWMGKVTNKFNESAPDTRLAELTMPTLIVSGTKDVKGMRQVSDLLTKSLPSVRRAEIGGAGHFPAIESANQFNRIFGTFLSDLQDGAAKFVP